MLPPCSDLCSSLSVSFSLFQKYLHKVVKNKLKIDTKDKNEIVWKQIRLIECEENGSLWSDMNSTLYTKLKFKFTEMG